MSVAVDLPTLPAAHTQALAMMSRHDAGAAEIAAIVGGDPAPARPDRVDARTRTLGPALFHSLDRRQRLCIVTIRRLTIQERAP